MSSPTRSERPPPLRRAAALLALAAPLAGVVLVIGGFARNAPDLLLGLVLLVAACVAIWYALTRRGAQRIAGVIGAALALAGLVAIVVIAAHGLLELVLLIGLLACFGLAARYALGHDERSSRVPADSRRLTPRPRKPVLIINLRSGGGKAQRFGLAEEAERRGIEPVILRPGDDLRKLAQDAVARGADVLGMAGGDGSQALVATVAMEHDVAHVCIPAGTRNHFALDLGLDRDHVVGALDAYGEAIERVVDLGRVNDRVFVNNASLGVYAKIVQSEAYRDAKLETWARMLPDLLGPDAPPIDLEFTTPDAACCADAPLVLVSNNPYELTHLAGAGTRARMDTGKLGIVAARIRNSADVAELVPLELVGQASRFPGLLEWASDAFTVRSNARIEVGLDGEALLLDPPLRFESLPGALRVRLPAGAPGSSPAQRAVALTPSNLSLLVATAAGRRTTNDDTT